MSRGMGFPTMWYVRPAKPQTKPAQSDQSLCWSLEYSMSFKLLNEHNFSQEKKSEKLTSTGIL